MANTRSILMTLTIALLTARLAAGQENSLDRLEQAAMNRETVMLGVTGSVVPEATAARADVCDMASGTAATDEEAEQSAVARLAKAFAQAIDGVAVDLTKETSQFDLNSRFNGDGSRELHMVQSWGNSISFVWGGFRLPALTVKKREYLKAEMIGPDGKTLQTLRQAVIFGCMNYIELRDAQFEHGALNKLQALHQAALAAKDRPRKVIAVTGLRMAFRRIRDIFPEAAFADSLTVFEANLIAPLEKDIAGDLRLDNRDYRVFIMGRPSLALPFWHYLVSRSSRAQKPDLILTTALSTSMALASSDHPAITELIRTAHDMIPSSPEKPASGFAPDGKHDIKFYFGGEGAMPAPWLSLLKEVIVPLRSRLEKPVERLRLKPGRIDLWDGPPHGGGKKLPGVYLSFGESAIVLDRAQGSTFVRLLDGFECWISEKGVVKEPRAKKAPVLEPIGTASSLAEAPLAWTVSGHRVPVFDAQNRRHEVPGSSAVRIIRGTAVPGRVLAVVWDADSPTFAGYINLDDLDSRGKALEGGAVRVAVKGAVTLRDARTGSTSKLKAGDAVFLIARQAGGWLVMGPKKWKVGQLPESVLKP